MKKKNGRREGEDEKNERTRTKRCDPVDGRTPTEQEGGVSLFSVYAKRRGLAAAGRSFTTGRQHRPTFAFPPAAHHHHYIATIPSHEQRDFSSFFLISEKMVFSSLSLCVCVNPIEERHFLLYFERRGEGSSRGGNHGLPTP